jgi:FERM central domain/IQ calmodulin-binding motif
MSFSIVRPSVHSARVFGEAPHVATVKDPSDGCEKIRFSVTFLDTQQRSILVSSRDTVETAIQRVCDKLGFGDPAIASVYVGLHECFDGVTLRSPLNRDALIGPIINSWPKSTAEAPKVVFAFSVITEALHKSPDPRVLYQLYIHAVHSVISGRYKVSLEEAILLGAIYLQEKFGDYDQTRHGTAGYFTSLLTALIPTPFFSLRKAEEWEADIRRKYARLSDEQRANPQRSYLNKLRPKDFYGCSFFRVTPSKKSGLPEKLILGVGAFNGIVFFDSETNSSLERYSLSSLFKWGCTSPSGGIISESSSRHNSAAVMMSPALGTAAPTTTSAAPSSSPAASANPLNASAGNNNTAGSDPLARFYFQVKDAAGDQGITLEFKTRHARAICSLLDWYAQADLIESGFVPWPIHRCLPSPEMVASARAMHFNTKHSHNQQQQQQQGNNGPNAGGGTSGDGSSGGSGGGTRVNRRTSIAGKKIEPDRRLSAVFSVAAAADRTAATAAAAATATDQLASYRSESTSHHYHLHNHHGLRGGGSKRFINPLGGQPQQNDSNYAIGNAAATARSRAATVAAATNASIALAGVHAAGGAGGNSAGANDGGSAAAVGGVASPTNKTYVNPAFLLQQQQQHGQANPAGGMSASAAAVSASRRASRANPSMKRVSMVPQSAMMLPVALVSVSGAGRAALLSAMKRRSTRITHTPLSGAVAALGSTGHSQRVLFNPKSRRYTQLSASTATSLATDSSGGDALGIDDDDDDEEDEDEEEEEEDAEGEEEGQEGQAGGASEGQEANNTAATAAVGATSTASPVSAASSRRASAMSGVSTVSNVTTKSTAPPLPPGPRPQPPSTPKRTASGSTASTTTIGAGAVPEGSPMRKPPLPLGPRPGSSPTPGASPSASTATSGAVVNPLRSNPPLPPGSPAGAATATAGTTTATATTVAANPLAHLGSGKALPRPSQLKPKAPPKKRKSGVPGATAAAKRRARIAIVVIQRWYRSIREGRALVADFAATRIQARWRGYRSRTQFDKMLQAMEEDLKAKNNSTGLKSIQRLSKRLSSNAMGVEMTTMK